MTNSHWDQSQASGYLRWLLGSITCVAILALFFPIAYGANDDSGVPLSLGRIAGPEIDPLLTSQAPIFAVALASLYGQFPQVPWFGISLGIATALGLGLIGQAIPWRRLPAGMWPLVAGGMGILAFDAAFFWTFTKAMLLLQFAGFLQIFRWQFESDRRRFPYLAVVVALVLGYCFRWVFFHYTLVFAFPIALRFKRRHLVPILIVAAIFCAVRGADAFVHEQLYATDADHREWKRFNDQRSRLHDMPEGYENSHTPGALKRAGWEEDDYHFFRDLWGIYDERVVTAESLKAFLDENSRGSELAAFLALSRESPWPQGVRDNYQTNKAVMAAMALPILVLIVGSLCHGGLGLLRNTLVVSGFLGLFGYLLFVRLPVRVGEPVMLYAGAVLAVVMGFGTRARLRGSILATIIVLQCAAIVPYWFSFARTIRGHTRANQTLREFLGQLDPAITGKTMIAIDPRRGLSAEANHPLWGERQFDRGLIVVPSGCNINSASYRRFLRRHGYDGGRSLLLGAMTDGKVSFFSYSDGPEMLRLWTSYLNRRLAKDAGRNVEFHTLATSRDGSMSILELVEAK